MWGRVRSTKGGVMVEEASLTEQFEASRPRLQAVAYRMLGSRAEAEDAVQETWLRLARTDAARVENLGGWLTTVVARVCLDRLRSRRARPEDPVDAIATSSRGDRRRRRSRAHEAIVAESVGAALLVVLDLLPPAERVAFVLHDVFAVPFDEVAEILDRSPDATRQLASRARRRLHGTAADGRPRPRPPAPKSSTPSCARRAAATSTRSCSLLDPDVVLRPDAAAVAHGVAARDARRRRGRPRVVGRSARCAARDRRRPRRLRVGARRADPRRREFTIVDGERIVAIDVTGDAERHRASSTSSLLDELTSAVPSSSHFVVAIRHTDDHRSHEEEP